MIAPMFPRCYLIPGTLKVGRRQYGFLWEFSGLDSFNCLNKSGQKAGTMLHKTNHTVKWRKNQRYTVFLAFPN